MRKMIWTLLPVAALALVGCNNHDAAGTAASTSAGATPAAASTATEITGTITLSGESGQPSPQAKLDIQLVDVSSGKAGSAPPVATKTIAPATQFPLQYQLKFNRSDINHDDIYVVKAQMVDGKRNYTMALQAPVLTKGSSSQANIQLVAQKTPGEKDLAAFNAVKEQIGGMKIKSGTKLEPDASRGWQVFRKDGQVRFIREQVEYTKKGFTHTDYAYKDGKPFVAVQEQKPSQSAKPSVTERASWGADGKPVLEQSVGPDGKVTALSDDEAASLHQQAETILKLAAGGKGK